MEEKKESDYYSGLVQLITDPDLTAARVDAASGRDNKVVAREGRSLVDDDLSTTVENYCTVRISLYSSLIRQRTGKPISMRQVVGTVRSTMGSLQLPMKSLCSLILALG